MMFRRSVFLSVFIMTAMGLQGQYTKEFKRIFFDADYLYETGFYEEAFSRYKNLLTLDPGNSNILFLCGACCLEIPGNEDEAVTFLKDAAQGVSKSYKEGSHKESGAPVLTYFMLGQAYHHNYQFEEAIENYERYLEAGDNQPQMQLDYSRMQIEACKRASELERDRPSFEFSSVLDHFDDDLPSCSNPVISGNGDMLIFLVDYPSDKKIMMSTKTGDLWSRPRVINSEIGMVGETYPVSLSYDGDELYLMHQFYSHSDIFVSRLQGSRWTEAEALGYNINGRTSETHASISRDGNTLYFTSDVRGGSGSFDIYVSHKDEKGKWGEAENLGPTINTPFEEHTPFISGNDSILFFSSQGHNSIGGMDVFYSKLDSYGVWSEPVNLGYPVNTTGDDVFFNPGWDELGSYYAVPRPDDPTSNTINMVMELEYEEELAESPVEDVPEVKTEELAALNDEAVDTEVIPETEPDIPETIIEVIEPEETDEIEEILNRDSRKPKEEEVVPEPEPEIRYLPGPAIDVPQMFETAVPFELNSYRLNIPAQLELERIAELMNKHPQAVLELVGHADATGSSRHNMLLSFQRAEAVALGLERKGIDRKRILVDGKGDTAPLAKDRNPDGSDSPIGRYLNRQVIVRVAGSVPLGAELLGVYVPIDLSTNHKPVLENVAQDYLYTIQVGASMAPQSKSRFEDLDQLTEYACTDGYFRYTAGAYHSFQEASDQIRLLRKSGYEDAFIQTLEWYKRAMK